ncbi:cyclic nucleotide-binding domain-containing protein [Methylobacterium radiodurans]|uniref:Cyclic nucleotide-binding protein n=1 Tax=Methylobacterium radiodurans TaxID=2202828 RepID=A0A2U8VNI4_9HYPH|nr:cyclic nucleotide-binding domain-containing protein [Methylobacterium radiodurans]AWN34936.1 cyclic nucleotide-binding protein [Methylobacterium radiodurans]
MAIDDDIAVLAAAPLLRFFGRDALRLLSFAAERRDLAPDEILFRRGEATDGGFVVVSGRVVLVPQAAGAAPVEAGRAALIGQMALFVRGERPGDARAAEPTSVLRITPALMRRVLEEFPDAAAAIHDALAEDLAGLSQGLERVRGLLAAG